MAFLPDCVCACIMPQLSQENKGELEPIKRLDSDKKFYQSPLSSCIPYNSPQSQYQLLLSTEVSFSLVITFNSLDSTPCYLVFDIIQLEADLRFLRDLLLLIVVRLS